ncbi:hypothetical protein KY317_01870 [Candidatus Woesearchaeota archaeon]|nr:hypothetical protein [Candidatus Woesearchaeota archaeon]
MNKIFLISMFILIFTVNLISASDVLVWQGQYYTGTTFNTGTYEFNFTVYDNLTGGNACFSNTTDLTTGNWGEWKTEQSGVNSACNNISKDYYLNININGIDQTPRRRLVIWNYLRKNVDEQTIGTITIGENSTILGETILSSVWVVEENFVQRFGEAETTAIERIGSERKEASVRLQEEIEIEKARLSEETNRSINAINHIARVMNASNSTSYSRKIERIELVAEEERAKLNFSAGLMWEVLDAHENIALQKIRSAEEIAARRITEEERLHDIKYEYFAQHNPAKAGEIRQNLAEKANISRQVVADAEDEAELALAGQKTNHTLELGRHVGNLTALINQAEQDVINSIQEEDTIVDSVYGFFTWLGSLTNRVTKLFVQDIDVNGTIDGSGNIDLTGNIKTDGDLTVEGDFALGGDLELENNLNVDKNISAEQYIADNQAGVTDDSLYSICIDVNGTACDEWCTLEITGGLITGCG